MPSRRHSNLTRRRVLAVGALVALAGCVSDPPGGESDPTRTTDTSTPDAGATDPTADDTASATLDDDPPGVSVGPAYLANETDEERTVAFRVERGDETILDVERAVAAGARSDVELPVEDPGDYRLWAAAGDHEDEYDWTVTRCDYDYFVVTVTTDDVVMRHRRQTVSPTVKCSKWTNTRDDPE